MYAPGTHVLYTRKSTNQIVVAVMVGPSPIGADRIHIHYRLAPDKGELGWEMCPIHLIANNAKSSCQRWTVGNHPGRYNETPCLSWLTRPGKQFSGEWTTNGPKRANNRGPAGHTGPKGPRLVPLVPLGNGSEPIRMRPKG